MVSKIEVDEIVNQTGDNDSGIDLSTNDNIKFNIAGSQKAIIDSNGKMGVGTIEGGADGLLAVKTNSNNHAIAIEETSGSEAYAIGVESDGSLGFYNSGGTTPVLKIDDSGNLLQGCTATPSSSVSGNRIANILSIGACIFSVGNYSSAVQMLIFMNANGNVGNIVTNGSGTSYNTSSDYRLKENVVTEWDATTRLKQLKPSRFNFKADKDTTVDGFLAHEVSSIVPEAISGEKDAVDADGNPEYQGIDQSKLVPLLVKTIQELEARITALEGA